MTPPFLRTREPTVWAILEEGDDEVSDAFPRLFPDENKTSSGSRWGSLGQGREGGGGGHVLFHLGEVSRPDLDGERAAAGLGVSTVHRECGRERRERGHARAYNGNELVEHAGDDSIYAKLMGRGGEVDGSDAGGER